MEASDPLVAISILNSLKRDHSQEWDKRVEKILLLGLREKFKQNPKLLKYLGDTKPLTLGEASKDPKWGIGFSLEEKEVLDTSKWIPTGNLLGCILMRVRGEFFENPIHHPTDPTPDTKSPQPDNPKEATTGPSHNKAKSTTSTAPTPNRPKENKSETAKATSQSVTQPRETNRQENNTSATQRGRITNIQDGKKAENNPPDMKKPKNNQK